MNDISCRLFGRFVAHHHDQPLTHLRHAKAQELFCWLLLSGDRPHHREVVASQLWGDVPTRQSRKYLRQALWQLQSALRASDNDCGALLMIDTDWIHLTLNRASGVWVDVFEFLTAFDQVQRVPAPKMDSRDAQVAERAVSLYTGDLLEGWYQDWCQEERHRLQSMFIVLVDKLAAYSEVQRRYDLVAAYSSRILHVDRAHERTHRRLIRMQHHIGDRTAALRQYHRCREALSEELGVEPSQSTENLYIQVMAFDDRNVVDGEPALHHLDTTLMPEVLEQLEQLRVLLDGLEAQVRAHAAMKDVTSPNTAQVSELASRALRPARGKQLRA